MLKKILVLWKLELTKLYINKLVNVPIILNNLKTKVDDSDDGELKAVPIDLTKLIADEKVVKEQCTTN